MQNLRDKRTRAAEAEARATQAMPPRPQQQIRGVGALVTIHTNAPTTKPAQPVTMQPHKRHAGLEEVLQALVDLS